MHAPAHDETAPLLAALADASIEVCRLEDELAKADRLSHDFTDAQRQLEAGQRVQSAAARQLRAAMQASE